MAEPGDLDSAFMSGFTEANVSAAESKGGYGTL